MFERLRSENESRVAEIHGLKDVLVRETEKRARETDDLRGQVMEKKGWSSRSNGAFQMEAGMLQLQDAITVEGKEVRNRIQVSLISCIQRTAHGMECVGMRGGYVLRLEQGQKGEPRSSRGRYGRSQAQNGDGDGCPEGKMATGQEDVERGSRE